jgi:hypothetical protein
MKIQDRILAIALAGTDARPCHRLLHGIRRHDGEGAPGLRRRQLACQDLAGADRAMAVESRARRRWLCDRGFEGRDGDALYRGGQFGLRSAAVGQALGDAVEDPGVLGPSSDAARQSSTAMAGAPTGRRADRHSRGVQASISKLQSKRQSQSAFFRLFETSIGHY